MAEFTPKFFLNSLDFPEYHPTFSHIYWGYRTYIQNNDQVQPNLITTVWHSATIMTTSHLKKIYNSNRAFQLVVFNRGQKMALRAFYFIRALTKALTYYYINRSQRHLLAAIENNWFGVPIILRYPILVYNLGLI